MLLARAALLTPSQAATGPPSVAAANPAALPRCLGDTRSLSVSSGMPYTPIRVQGHTRFFELDLGADGSSISPTTFLGGQGPVPLAGSVDRFAGFDFFGPWDPVRLSVQDQSGIQGPLRQGLIGTDLIRAQVFTLDDANGLLHRASREAFSGDAQLRQAGFQALSSRGYFGLNVAELPCPAAAQTETCPTIPTIPLRVGRAQAVAQVDTGYDDGLQAPSLNMTKPCWTSCRPMGSGWSGGRRPISGSAAVCRAKWNRFGPIGYPQAAAWSWWAAMARRCAGSAA